MTELQLFLKMLDRAGIGHGLRYDYNPPGTAVQVEHEDDDNTTTDWWFNEAGELEEIYVCQH